MQSGAAAEVLKTDVSASSYPMLIGCMLGSLDDGFPPTGGLFHLFLFAPYGEGLSNHFTLVS